MTKPARHWNWAIASFLLVGMLVPRELQAQDADRRKATNKKSAAQVTAELKEGVTEAEHDRATEAVLDSLVIDFAFGDEREFREVLGDLTRQSGLQFLIDQSAEDCDLTKETAISFSAESMRLRTGLQLMLDRFHTTLVIRDGVVVIISIEAAADPQYFRRKMFDVENLIQLIIRTQGIKDRVYWVPAELVSPRGGGESVGNEDKVERDGAAGADGGMFSLPMPQQAVEATTAAQVGGGAADGVGKADALPGEKAAVAEDAAVEKPQAQQAASGSVEQSKSVQSQLVSITRTAREQAVEMLIRTVTSHVDPQEWADSGKGDGEIGVVGGVLVVSQTEDALHEVGGLLRELENKLAEIVEQRKEGADQIGN